MGSDGKLKLGAAVVFVLDNYDSFTYNQVTVSEIESLQPERIVISPGPCTPQDAGISIDLIRHFAGKIPILGVCLGHQAIGAAFGGNVVRAPHLMHGKTSAVTHDNKSIFKGLPTPMTATRYHSLIVEEKDLPEELEVSAWTRERDGTRTIMGLRHKKYAVEGVQFHPESVLTDAGKRLVENFLTSVGG
jgi:anthranilate synthase/aminodeoxychorismate synthase-like glutamine amidotransferase